MLHFFIHKVSNSVALTGRSQLQIASSSSVSASAALSGRSPFQTLATALPIASAQFSGRCQFSLPGTAGPSLSASLAGSTFSVVLCRATPDPQANLSGRSTVSILNTGIVLGASSLTGRCSINSSSVGLILGALNLIGSTRIVWQPTTTTLVGSVVLTGRISFVPASHGAFQAFYPLTGSFFFGLSNSRQFLDIGARSGIVVLTPHAQMSSNPTVLQRRPNFGRVLNPTTTRHNPLRRKRRRS